MLRNFFALLLVHCHPKEPQTLWEKYKRDLSEDYRLQLGEVESERIAYRKIAEHLEAMGRPITEFPDMPPLRDVDWSLENIDMLAEGFEAQDLYELLRNAQREFVDAIIAVLLRGDDSKARCFYLNGHAGTGKSFIYRFSYIDSV